MTLGGPMFEPVRSGYWESTHRKEGAHYNTYGCGDEQGMAALRAFFRGGEADEMNLCLFSTSGVHGTYATIEDAEATIKRGMKDEDGEDSEPSVTFLVVQPRIVCLRYGNCIPRTEDDIAFLKKLRASSWREFQKIGKRATS